MALMKGAHMLFSAHKLRRALFGISIEETTFVKRGCYRGDARAQQKLECIGRTFVQGYHAALDDDHFDILVPTLEGIEEEYRGFAYEGAAMGLALLDYFSSRQQRLTTFMQGPGVNHI